MDNMDRLLPATKVHNGQQGHLGLLAGVNLYIPEHEGIIADS